MKFLDGFEFEFFRGERGDGQGLGVILLLWVFGVGIFFGGSWLLRRWKKWRAPG